MIPRRTITGLVGLALLGAAPLAVWLTAGTVSVRPFVGERSGTATIPAQLPPPAPALAASGRVEPRSEPITLAADLTGQLKTVNVEEGQHVTRGQILAEYVNTDLAARLAETRARVDARQAELKKLLAGARPEEREAAAARFREAEAQVSLAQSENARRRMLRSSGAVSSEEADRAHDMLAAAEARRDAAKAALTLINAPPRDEDVQMARAALQLVQAQEKEAEGIYDKTLVRAPIDGIVLRRFRKTGEAVGNLPPTPILELGESGPLRVRAEVDEADLGRLGLGQRVYLKASAYGERRFGGVVARIAPELGRKRVFSGRPAEKLDTDVLETEIDLDSDVQLPIGLRVDVFFEAPRS